MPPRRRKAAPKKRAPPKSRPARAPRRRAVRERYVEEYVPPPPPAPVYVPPPPLPKFDFTPAPQPMPMPMWQPPQMHYYGPTAAETAANNAKLNADLAAIKLQGDLEIAKLQADINTWKIQWERDDRERAETNAALDASMAQLNKEHEAMKQTDAYKEAQAWRQKKREYELANGNKVGW